MLFFNLHLYIHLQTFTFFIFSRRMTLLKLPHKLKINVGFNELKRFNEKEKLIVPIAYRGMQICLIYHKKFKPSNKSKDKTTKKRSI